MASETKDTALTVSYKSPESEHFTITHNIPTPPSTSVQDKSRFLEALRKVVADTQEQINQELTTRMEQDKAREAASGGTAAARLATDEDKEEQNYGEEAQEEEG